MASYFNVPATDFKWTPLVRQIAEGKPSAIEELYTAFNSLRFYFCRHLGPDSAEDAYHDLIGDLVGQIRDGCLRDPERIAGYVRTIAERKVVRRLRVVIHARNGEVRAEDIQLPDRRSDPESLAIEREHKAIAGRILAAMPARDREVLVRFYLHSEDPASIQAQMGLTATQFRLLKSHAKARFGELCRQSMTRRKPAAGPSAFARN